MSDASMIRDEPAALTADHPPFVVRLDADQRVMALMSPATVAPDVDRHTAAFAEAVEALFG
jgi:hypothetical protein